MDLAAIRAALTAIGEEHAGGQWRITLDQEDCQTAIENRLTARIGATGGRLHAGRSRNDQVLAALRLYLRDAAEALYCGAIAVADALDDLAARDGSVELPGYTHMQQAMPSTVALWAGGFAAEIRDDALGLREAKRRAAKNPLGSAAGYGTPNLDVNRESTRRRLDFEVTHEPVTAVQLSRGKAEAHLLFEITLLTQDLGRLHHGLLDHAPEAQPRRLRVDARPQLRGPCRARRGLEHHPEVDFGLPPRSAAHQATVVPRHRFLPADPGNPAERPRRCALQAGWHPS
jgi:argininosuccinate lyase